MPWIFDSDRPIYTQVLEHIRLLIISGQYPPGSRLPSVRDLAVEASVNPNTMQRALSELEQSGLLYSQRTAGRFVTEDTALIEKIRQAAAEDTITAFIRNMKQLGFSIEETCELLRTHISSIKGGTHL